MLTCHCARKLFVILDKLRILNQEVGNHNGGCVLTFDTQSRVTTLVVLPDGRLAMGQEDTEALSLWE